LSVLSEVVRDKFGKSDLTIVVAIKQLELLVYLAFELGAIPLRGESRCPRFRN